MKVLSRKQGPNSQVLTIRIRFRQQPAPSAFVSRNWATFYQAVCIGSNKKTRIARASQGNFIESFKFLVNNTKATQRRQQIASKCWAMRNIWMINRQGNEFKEFVSQFALIFIRIDFH